MKTLDAVSDGRNIDERLGALSGVGAALHVESSRLKVERRIPDSELSTFDSRLSYYGQPVLKEPVWIWTVPAYFYIGGVAGAASLLGAALDLTGGPAQLARRCHRVAAASDMLSAGLLISDLGRPSRFLNMLRVFNPRSPMSVGSWILSGSGAVNTLAAIAPGPVGRLAGAIGGLLGIPLAGYTAVLLSNTAVPVWQATRRSLPLVFMSSAVASAGNLLQLLPGSEPEHRAARTFALLGQAGALASTVALHAEARRAGRAARPLTRGASGALLGAAAVLGAASLALALVPRPSKRRRRTAAVLGTLGALALRFGLFHAGKSSARDPHATFSPQREGTL